MLEQQSEVDQELEQFMRQPSTGSTRVVTKVMIRNQDMYMYFLNTFEESSK
jgi:hypothetical protein